MKISKEKVGSVAHLARLDFDENETRQLTGQLNTILDYIGKLEELDTKAVEPTSHAVSVVNAFREDERKSDFTVREALANAPDEEDGSFKVPKVIE